MKKLICLLLLALVFSGCAAEAPVPTDEEIAQKAIPLFELIAGCPSVTSFEEVPDAQLMQEAVSAYLAQATPGEAPDPAAAYALLFQNGEYEAPSEPLETGFLPARAEVDGTVNDGRGTIIASVRTEIDYGFGYEFAFYVDIHIRPDETAPFGARITRVFFPE